MTLGKSSTLDLIGKLVQTRPRGTLSDTRMADMIAAQIEANKSNGSPEDMIRIYNAFFSTTLGPLLPVNDATDYVGGFFPAGKHATVLSNDPAQGLHDDTESIRNGIGMLAQVAPGGNRVILIAAVEPTCVAEDCFRLDSTSADGPEKMLAALDSPSDL